MRDVAFSCDNNGAPFLCVTVWSLLEHYHGDEPLRVNVFEGWGGHSPENKAKLQSIVDSFNEVKVKGEGEQRSARSVSADQPKKEGAHHCSPSPSSFTFFSLRYHNVESCVEPYADILMNRENSRWNIFTWTPIFTPQILADAEGNVAHFDIDMLFNDDVSKILDTDFSSSQPSTLNSQPLIACVAEYGKGDPIITEAVWGKGILPDSVERYFNTGTIVFNTAKCREERTWEKIVAWYREHYDIADRIEQDAWNALYHDRTILLPLRWNFHDRLIKSFAKWNPFVKYWQGNPPRECYEAALNPAILHFWGPKKPWKPSHRPYRKLYHAAMRAVGQRPPLGQPLCIWYTILNWLNLEKIRNRRRLMSNWGFPISDSGAVLDGLRKWERRCLFKSLKHRLLMPLEWIGIGLGWMILPMLPHRLMLGVCDLVAVVMHGFDRDGRALALRNLRIVMGNTDMEAAVSCRERRIVRGSYRNMARTVGHAFWTSRGAKEKVVGVGELSQGCHKFLAANRPAVTVSGHIGCWEMLSQLALLDGHAMVSVAKRIGSEGMTRLLMKARMSIGQEIVPADGAFKPLMAGIRAGKSLGLLVDQKVDPSDGGVWVRFFGRPIPVSAAPAFFSSKSGAPIVVAWSHPIAGGRYRCEMLDVITAVEARDIWLTTQRCTRDLERVIRRHPSRWVMNYDFFSTRPTEKDLATLVEREERYL